MTTLTFYFLQLDVEIIIIIIIIIGSGEYGAKQEHTYPEESSCPDLDY